MLLCVPPSAVSQVYGSQTTAAQAQGKGLVDGNGRRACCGECCDGGRQPRQQCRPRLQARRRRRRWRCAIRCKEAESRVEIQSCRRSSDRTGAERGHCDGVRFVSGRVVAAAPIADTHRSILHSPPCVPMAALFKHRFSSVADLSPFRACCATVVRAVQFVPAIIIRCRWVFCRGS
jgi:hypothetical protein